MFGTQNSHDFTCFMDRNVNTNVEAISFSNHIKRLAAGGPGPGGACLALRPRLLLPLLLTILSCLFEKLVPGLIVLQGAGRAVASPCHLCLRLPWLPGWRSLFWASKESRANKLHAKGACCHTPGSRGQGWLPAAAACLAGLRGGWRACLR